MAWHSKTFVVVTWDPVLHMVARDTQVSWIDKHKGTVATAWTQCSQSITGYIQAEEEGPVITCLTCIGAR